MSDDVHRALQGLMDAFAARHWQDKGLTPARATLSVEGDSLSCSVGDDTFVGHPTAPLWFVTGAWALIYAHECEGRFGHRVAGRVNRVWPNGASHDRADHGITEAVRTFAAHWPGRLFSASLYAGVDTEGQARRPRVLDDAPSRTTLTGVLKRVAAAADDPDPVQRLNVAEFIEDAVRTEWHNTAEDAMLRAVGPALAALSDDAEPAIRELAWLALETCAEACWQNRAYGLFEPICQRLIDLGSNAQLHYARLAESAYALGDMARGDAHWATAVAGQSPHRTIRLSAAFDHIGDWSDLRTRILRQAGGAHLAWAAGLDPNPARQDKLAKQGAQPPDADVAARHRKLAGDLLQAAIEGAQARLDIDLPALRAGSTITLGGGPFDPAQRRLFLPEIFALRARLAMLEGDEPGRLRAMFKAVEVAWQLDGSPEHWAENQDELVCAAAATYDDARLLALGMPACLAPQVAAWRTAQNMATSEGGREQLFWRSFLRKVQDSFLGNQDQHEAPLPIDALVDAFVVRREGATLRLSHPSLAEPVTGSLASPILTALQAWHQVLLATQGQGACVEANDYDVVTLDADEVSIVAEMAAQTLEAGARAEAIALYRFAHGTDPWVKPWPYRDPVPPLPADAVPASLRDEVARRSALLDEAELAKIKPRGRRVEQLATRHQSEDVVTARAIGHLLRDAAGQAGDSEIERVLKKGQAFLASLWAHPDPQVREAAIIPIFMVLHMHWLYAPGLDATALQTAAHESGIAVVPSGRDEG